MSSEAAAKAENNGRERSVSEMLAGIKVVDADVHITEWEDLWTSRAPAKYKDRVPQLRDIDGRRMWTIDEHVIASDSGFAAIKKDGSKAIGLDFFKLKVGDVTPGAYDVRARLEFMDEEGFAAQIAYTNLLGFGGPKAMKVDADLRLVSVQIQNDAMAELQRESSNRVYPMAMVPWWDIDETVKEVERCADMGMRGLNTHGNPETHGFPDLGDTYWTPLWEICEDRGLPINFHIGFSQGQDKENAEGWVGRGVWKSLPPYQQYSASGTMLFSPNMQSVINLLLSDLFERHPKLKFATVESGVGWVPYMLEMLDYQVRENLPDQETSLLEKFRQHIYCCGWAEPKGFISFIDQLGADNIMFQTDYPHPTCLYPDPLERFADCMAKMSDADRAKVFGNTAQELYNLDLSAAP